MLFKILYKNTNTLIHSCYELKTNNYKKVLKDFAKKIISSGQETDNIYIKNFIEYDKKNRQKTKVYFICGNLSQILKNEQIKIY